MKKTVVFGGSGFLGSYVADELSRRGYDVLVADIREPKSLPENQQFAFCDIRNPEEVAATVKDAAIVYNFAGMTDVDGSAHHPKKTMELNVVGNINILDACANQNIERFVYASSAYAMSNKGSFYGISKFASEKIVEEYFSHSGIPFSIVRYGSLYGERADDRNGIHLILRQALDKGEITFAGNGDEVREYIHAIDAAALSVDIVEDEKFMNTHLVLTGLERLRLRDLFQMIQEILNDQVSITYTEEVRERHYQVTPYSLQFQTGQKLVANPFIDLGQGLVNCVRHMQDDDGDEG